MNIIPLSMFDPEVGPLLAGKLDGKRTFARNLEKIAAVTAPAIIALNFHGIDLATSSFLNEAVVAFRDHLRLGRQPVYLMVANLGAKPREELDYLLARSSDALIACRLNSDGTVAEPTLLGFLDAKLRETYELVASKGETTAVQLHGESKDPDKIGPTAWNNRLSALAAKSLVIELPAGRTKIYKPLLEAA